MWVLSGIVIIILGFALRLNPMVVILSAAAATGIGGGLDLHAIISAFGKAFNDNRFITLIWMVLIAIGLLLVAFVPWFSLVLPRLFNFA